MIALGYSAGKAVAVASAWIGLAEGPTYVLNVLVAPLFASLGAR
ncbi:hypothetical protein SAMN05421810_10945 [Amycolatopsis arida]|uniref:Uncharacterized protein n=1 Tax=Amycolatopsis arida TaxID=587909 RepID=A0A1I5ZCQ0_9PSEU|nr:hypothetical protein [Amycolatopsis arida]TDX89524.1 hypothetical protein CLV69_10944 [Amycolatopsis arida]SFQ54215.1 hypothetical protein SAMN05421810_10945 [Amycolatopsis arida]